MIRKRTVLVALVVVVGAFAAPAAAQPGDQVDQCKNADNGPGGDGGPPGFVGKLVPDFLGDLFSDLPVPGFLKSWTGAESC